ncbi:MAG: phosphatase PAP2 family protein [Lachnospiraceae bacterium]|jgi:membrane-associated phospholipid phosphatase|nr:phosphatase PAP2 family protein [Lachnospiraceae bacterium]
MAEWLMNWEGGFLLFLQEHVRNPLLDNVMRFVTSLGDAGFIAIIACIVLLGIRRYRRVGVKASLSLILDFVVVNVLLKNLVARARPYQALKGLLLLVEEATDYSFPSGHSGACFAVASVMFLCLPRKVGVPAIGMAALIAFSRLYVGIHYPTDVLGGILIGCLTGWTAWKVLWREKT